MFLVKNNQDIKTYYYVAFAALFKLLFLYFYIGQYDSPMVEGFWGRTSPDTGGYIDPIENLLKTGTYFPRNRMPGYGGPFLPIIALFPKGLAFNIIIVLQALVDGIACFVLARTAYMIANRELAFWLTFICATISTYVSIFDAFVLTDSLSASAQIFALYFGVRYLQQGIAKDAALAGIMIAWLIFMKPVYVPLLAVFSLVFFVKDIAKGKKVASSAFSVFVLWLPFLIADLAWIYSNYMATSKITFLQPRINAFAGARKSVIKFTQAIGGDAVPWNPKAEIRFWGYKGSGVFPKAGTLPEPTETLPQHIFTTRFNYDSLLIVRELIGRSYDSTLTVAQRGYYDSLASHTLDAYTLSIKTETPFQFYVNSRLTMLRKFLLHSGTYNLFTIGAAELGAIGKILKVGYSLLYILVTVLGSFCLLIFWAWAWKNSSWILLALSTVYGILIFPFLGFIEYRYSVATYPLMLLCTVLLLDKGYEWLLTRKRNG